MVVQWLEPIVISNKPTNQPTNQPGNSQPTNPPTNQGYPKLSREPSSVTQSDSTNTLGDQQNFYANCYANLFLAEWWEKALEKCVLKPSVYWRFLDDIFMIWEHSMEEFYKFVKILNTHHPSITVKAELSSESMPF